MEDESETIRALYWTCEVMDIPKKPGDSPVFLRRCLADYLEELRLTNFNKLLSLLYRIDVSRRKIEEALAENFRKQSPGETLAQLIIQRQTEKLKTRQKYSRSFK